MMEQPRLSRVLVVLLAINANPILGCNGWVWCKDYTAFGEMSSFLRWHLHATVAQPEHIPIVSISGIRRLNRGGSAYEWYFNYPVAD